MRLRFTRAMDESTSLFREEHKALALIKRLQEQHEYVETSPFDAHAWQRIQELTLISANSSMY